MRGVSCPLHTTFFTYRTASVCRRRNTFLHAARRDTARVRARCYTKNGDTHRNIHARGITRRIAYLDGGVVCRLTADTGGRRHRLQSRATILRCAILPGIFRLRHPYRQTVLILLQSMRHARVLGLRVKKRAFALCLFARTARGTALNAHAHARTAAFSSRKRSCAEHHARRWALDIFGTAARISATSSCCLARTRTGRRGGVNGS